MQAVGKKKVTLVGYGGSAAGLKGVAAGTWYGDVVQLPATEGRLAIAVRDQGRPHRARAAAASIPVADLPDEGVVTKANVAKFTGEWPG